MAPPNVVPLVFMGLIGWRVYRRVRRSIGRQPVRTKRLTTGIIIYSVICIMLAVGAMQHPKVLAGLGGGLLLGVPLGLGALRFTRFENTPEGRFYTSHPYIGISIAAVLVIRMFYRMTLFFGSTQHVQASTTMMQSPLTFSLFGLLAGYYITFYIGVMMRSGKVEVAQSV
jgi:hypothetical protein